MTLPYAAHIGTFTAASNKPRATEPYHSLAHALASGIAMAAFLGAAVLWLGSL